MIQKKNHFMYVLPPIIAGILFYLNRFLIPDWSFDVINYHLFNGLRGLKNFFIPFNNSEFFPLGICSFPSLYDSIYEIFRNILGYRLGTLPGLISYILIIVLIYKSLELLNAHFFEKVSLYKIILFFCISISLESIFELATYYGDNVNTLFHLSGFYYLIKFAYFDNKTGQKENNTLRKNKYIILASILFGLSLFGKNTSLIYVIPFCICALLLIIKNNKTYKDKILITLISAFSVFILFFVYCTFSFIRTGNPVFPFYNNIFKSNLFEPKNYIFPTGPKNITETILWPLYAFSKPEKYGEIQAVYNDGKISIFFILLLTLIIYIKFSKKSLSNKEKTLLLFYFGSYCLWIIRFGYSRYGIALEYIGSILLISLFIKYVNKPLIKKIVSSIFLVIIFWPTYKILMLNLKYDYSVRPTYINNTKLHKDQIPFLFSDKNILPEEIKTEINNSDIILNFYNGSNPHSGFYTITNAEDKTMIFLENSAKRFGFSDNYVNKTNAKLLSIYNKNQFNFFMICFQHESNKDFSECMNEVNIPGYKIKKYFDYENYLGYKYPGRKYLFRYIFGEYTINKQNNIF